MSLSFDVKINRLVLAMEVNEHNYRFLSDAKRHEGWALYFGIEKWFIHISNSFSKIIPLDRLRLSRRTFIYYLKELKRLRSNYFDSYICKMINDLFESISHLVSSSEENAFRKIVEALSPLGFIWNNERRQLLPNVGHPVTESVLTSELEHYLQKLGKPYLDKYIGAWDAFLSNHRDRNRNAITSMRTLYENILNELAPNEKFQKPTTEFTRKDRLRYIFRASNTEKKYELRAIDQFLKFYDEINTLHQKGTHVKEGLDRQTTLFALKTSEYALYYILSTYFAK